ncbi:hypothetical protein ACFPPE_00040 [Agromyces tardus]|uniref:hypothetical protein n=1 Tax=Agromyces tardus TaxID=2583849 RepID=UPI001485AD26|nr:hypothetical protein [Agromyces tardus]
MESVAVATSEESWALLATDGANLVIATPYNRGVEPDDLAPAVAALIAARGRVSGVTRIVGCPHA